METTRLGDASRFELPLRDDASIRHVELALAELDRAGAELGEVRGVTLDREWIAVRNDRVERCSFSRERGVGMRAFVQGAWGYAATDRLEPTALREAARRAVAIATANAAQASEPLSLGSPPTSVGQYATPVERDPFTVPPGEKIELLRRATRAARTHDEIRMAEARCVSLRRRTIFRSTAGAAFEQLIILCGGGVSATAIGEDDVQTRSYPKGFEGDVRAAGWEYVESLDLVQSAAKMAEEARELLRAPATPSGRRTLILDGSQLSLQIHESCGHPVELDRALGEEISLAGCSFLDPGKMGSFRYGSDLVTLYADSTSEGGPGSFGWDDEGTPAGRWDIVRDGRFVGYLGSRETAGRVAGSEPGALRSVSYDMLPIVRMVNINLEPGDTPLAQMIAETEDGVYMAVNKSWSIDDFRLNFQFSCEVAWEIKDGELGRMLKNPLYTGKTPTFWAGCDAIAPPDEWRMWGWMFCGKGDPMQTIHVGHGCAPARFRDVEIGTS